MKKYYVSYVVVSYPWMRHEPTQAFHSTVAKLDKITSKAIDQLRRTLCDSHGGGSVVTILSWQELED